MRHGLHEDTFTRLVIPSRLHCIIKLHVTRCNNINGGNYTTNVYSNRSFQKLFFRLAEIYVDVSINVIVSLLIFTAKEINCWKFFVIFYTSTWKITFVRKKWLNQFFYWKIFSYVKRLCIFIVIIFLLIYFVIRFFF